MDNFHLLFIIQLVNMHFPVDNSVDKSGVFVDNSGLPVDNFFACG